MTRILIVEDEASIRLIVSTMLTMEGFDVDTASDGRMALQKILANPPDLVLSDVRMPHMNGYELLDAIRANPDLHQVRVILLAGFNEHDPATPHARALADACLTKPFSRDILLETLRTITP